jgi:hypothetical protein
MGLFGNLGDTVYSLSNALESLVTHPFKERNYIYGFAKGSAMFVKGTVTAVTGSIGSILESLKRGFNFLVINPQTEVIRSAAIDKELFEDDIG